jgi:hypothetical protein
MEIGSNEWMSDAKAGEVVANVIELRTRSYDALPSVFAYHHDWDFPEDFFAGQFEATLLAIHAQAMFKANVLVLDKMLASQRLTKEDIAAVMWLRSAAESLSGTIESLRNHVPFYVPAEVERAAKPFAGEVPF